MPKYTLDDFSGGLTDNVEDAPLNKLERAENVTTTYNKKIRQRFGINQMFDYFSSVITRTNAAVAAIALKFIESDLFLSSGGNLERVFYSYATDGLTAIDIAGRGNITPNTLRSFSIATVTPASGTYTPATTSGSRFTATDRGVYWLGGSFGDVLKYPGPFSDTFVNASLPKYDSGFNFVSAGAGVGPVSSYIYTVHYFYQYAYQGRTYIEFGQTYLRTLSTQQPGSGTLNITLTGLVQAAVAKPNRAIATGGGSTFSGVAVYRTKANGTTSYFVGVVLHPSTTFFDNKLDSAIPVTGSSVLLPAVLYTDGGALDDASPPIDDNVIFTKLTYANNCMWYVSNDGYTLYQSKPLVYGSIPGSFTLRLINKIVEINTVDIYPIIFSVNSIERVEGTVDARGVGISRIRNISTNIFTISNSVVRVDNLLYFITHQGFFSTDGFKVNLINDDLVNTIGKLTSVITAVHLAQQQKVFWLVKITGRTKNCILEMDLSLQGTPIVMFFDGEDKSYNVTSITDNREFLCAGTDGGYLIKFNPYLSSDLLPSTGLVTTWVRQPILPRFTTVPVSLGERFTTKWFTKVYFFVKNFGPLWPNLSFEATSITEANLGAGKVLTPIRERGITDAIFSIKRWFTRGRIRSRYRQIAIDPSFVVITNSDTLGVATTNPGVPNVVLDSGNFPVDILPGQLIYFEVDGYTTGYLINSISSNTLILNSAPPALVSSLWLIRGYPTDEILHMDAIELEFAPSGETIKPVSTESLGGNQ